MMRKLISCAFLAASVGVGACEKTLEVTNPTAGETKRVLGTPDDAENVLGSYYKRWHSGLYGTANANNPPGNFEGMANVMSLQNYSSLANNCQNQRAPFSGATNSNAPGNTCGSDQANVYFVENEVNRLASNFLVSVKNGLALASVARENRDKSFAEFLRGISLGYVAMFYDSSAIISPDISTDAAECIPDALSGVCIGKMKGYREVFDSAMAAFARAITYANAGGSGDNGFPLPSAWIPSPTSFTATEFVRLIRSYRARIRANVARTPAERAAVDWDAVIADAVAGITEDHLNTTSTTVGPFGGWRRIYDPGNTANTWHQMPPFFIGMADASGSYATWIHQPIPERGAGSVSFFMVTPDLRFPQGATRTAQQADFALNSCGSASQICKRYFINRPSGLDQNSGVGWGWSNYDFARYHSWQIRGDGTARNGNLVFFTKAELDLLEAEGQYRKGNYARVAELINKTRTRGMEPRSATDTNQVARGGGLPAVIADATVDVPGGAACVPKVPIAPTFDTVGCGKLWDALKYEKRIETAYTTFAPWYLDGRGWGDIPKDTPLFWAVPYQDLQARGTKIQDIYGAGIGPGNAANSAAALGVYGW